jgi:hypothetical protein
MGEFGSVCVAMKKIRRSRYPPGYFGARERNQLNLLICAAAWGASGLALRRQRSQVRILSGARASKDLSEQYRVRVSAAEAPRRSTVPSSSRGRAAISARRPATSEQLRAGHAVPSIKVEPGDDSGLSLEFRPEKTARSQVVMQTRVACTSRKRVQAPRQRVSIYLQNDS